MTKPCAVRTSPPPPRSIPRWWRRSSRWPRRRRRTAYRVPTTTTKRAGDYWLRWTSSPPWPPRGRRMPDEPNQHPYDLRDVRVLGLRTAVRALLAVQAKRGARREHVLLPQRLPPAVRRGRDRAPHPLEGGPAGTSGRRARDADDRGTRHGHRAWQTRGSEAPRTVWRVPGLPSLVRECPAAYGDKARRPAGRRHPMNTPYPYELATPEQRALGTWWIAVHHEVLCEDRKSV